MLSVATQSYTKQGEINTPQRVLDLVGSPSCNMGKGDLPTFERSAPFHQELFNQPGNHQQVFFEERCRILVNHLY